MTKLPNTNKGWKPLFVRVTDPNGFGIDLQWRVDKASGNQVPTFSLNERKYYKQIEDNEGFPWTLVHDGDEVEKFWSSAVLANADPLVPIPIGPEFHIGEPRWAGLTLKCTLYTSNTLFF